MAKVISGVNRFELAVLSILLILSLVPGTVASSIVALVVFLIFVVYCCLNKYALVLKYIPSFFSAVSAIAGVAVCEFTSVFLPELQYVSSFAGSLPLIVFCQSLFLCILLLGDRALETPDNGLADSWRLSKWVKNLLTIASFGVFALAFISFVNVASRPSFLYGYDRFQYADLLKGYWGLIAAYLPYLIIIPIMGIRFGVRRIGIAAVAVYGLFLFWIGTKFSTFFVVFGYFLLAYFDKFLRFDRRKKTRLLIATGFGLCALVGLSVFAYSSSGHSADSFLEQRLSQQGQLWWRTYSLSDPAVRIDANQLDIEIEALTDDKSISQSVGARNGIYGIMYLVAPGDRVDLMLSQGARYTEAGYAMSYYIFGYPGPVFFAVAMGFVVRLSRTALAESVIKGNFVLAVVWAILCGYVSVASTMFVFSQFFTPLGILLIAVAFVGALLQAHSTKSGLVSNGNE